MQANQSGSRGAAKAQRSEMPGLSRKRGLLGRLVIELQSDAVAKSPIKPLNVPLTWVHKLSSCGK